MEDRVDAKYCKEFDLIRYKVRCKWLLRGAGKDLTQSQGQRGFVSVMNLYFTLVSIIP